ncbi:MAG: BLUF domain-containing protein [Sandaracinaceae bacterium]
MLVRLIYASRSNSDITIDSVRAIAEEARHNNEAKFLTGMLGFARRSYLQVLEGSRDEVNALYQRISRDPRHTEVSLLSFTEIHERAFGAWSMGFLGRLGKSERFVLQFGQSDRFDPHTLTGESALRLLRAAQANVALSAAAPTRVSA